VPTAQPATERAPRPSASSAAVAGSNANAVANGTFDSSAQGCPASSVLLEQQRTLNWVLPDVLRVLNPAGIPAVPELSCDQPRYRWRCYEPV
jgi:hypothetical protein